MTQDQQQQVSQARELIHASTVIHKQLEDIAGSQAALQTDVGFSDLCGIISAQGVMHKQLERLITAMDEPQTAPLHTVKQERLV